jgi:hypothetical protein
MARSKREQELFDLLRARGLRKRVADTVAGAASKGKSRRNKLPKQVRGALDDLSGLRTEVEDRVTGRDRKRKAAGKKAAATRKRNAAKRSAAAKRGAKTRAKARA